MFFEVLSPTYHSPITIAFSFSGVPRDAPPEDAALKYQSRRRVLIRPANRNHDTGVIARGARARRPAVERVEHVEVNEKPFHTSRLNQRPR